MAKDKQLSLSTGVNDIDLNNDSGLTNQERQRLEIGKGQQTPKKSM